MIQTMYGRCIHSDLQKAMAEHALSSAFHLFACNTENVIAVLNNGTVKLPCVTPFVQSKYIVNPKVNSYKTTGVDGAETVHSFDFTSTMPVNLFVQFTILANNISDIEQMEKFLLELYSPSHDFSVSDFMAQGESFAFTITPDSKKEIQRSGADVTLANRKQKIYQSVLHFRCDRCVEFLLSYSPARLQLDADLQNQLVKRIVGLDATYDHFSKVNQNSADFPAEAITYAQTSISAVFVARATLVKALNIPAAYSSPQKVSKLYSLMNDTKCDLCTAIEKLDNQVVQQRIAEDRLRAQQAAYEEECRRADTEGYRAEEQHANSYERSTDSYYGSGGILSGVVNKINENNRRKQEMREEMYRQQRMLKDYYNTPKCQRYGLRGKKSCAGCPIAHMCKH